MNDWNVFLEAPFSSRRYKERHVVAQRQLERNNEEEWNSVDKNNICAFVLSVFVKLSRQRSFRSNGNFINKAEQLGRTLVASLNATRRFQPSYFPILLTTVEH